MADVAEATTTPEELAAEESPQAPESVTYGGTSKNLVPGMAMLLAGVLAFFMGMTDVFFAEAVAWTFIIWGALLIFAGMIDIYKSFEVTGEALIIRDPMRPWNRRKVWRWEFIRRLEIHVSRKDWRASNATMQIYFNDESDLGTEREDRSLDPELAQLIIERAGLRPASADNPRSLEELPLEQKATYSWQ